MDGVYALGISLYVTSYFWICTQWKRYANKTKLIHARIIVWQFILFLAAFVSCWMHRFDYHITQTGVAREMESNHRHHCQPIVRNIPEASTVGHSVGQIIKCEMSREKMEHQFAIGWGTVLMSVLYLIFEVFKIWDYWTSKQRATVSSTQYLLKYISCMC